MTNYLGRYIMIATPLFHESADFVMVPSFMRIPIKTRINT